MSILSTLGVQPPGGCHYPLEGWAEFARMVQPIIERDHYGLRPDMSITAPNLKRAVFANAARDTLTLEFDQPLIWFDQLASQFYLDGEPGHIASGSTGEYPHAEAQSIFHRETHHRSQRNQLEPEYTASRRERSRRIDFL